MSVTDTVDAHIREYLEDLGEALIHLKATATRTAQAAQDAAQEREHLRSRVRVLQDDLRAAQAGVRDLYETIRR